MHTNGTSYERWSFFKRAWTLFLTVYFTFLMIDIIHFDFEVFPHFFYALIKPYDAFWDVIVPWTGKNIIHLSYPITVKPNGSGDTTYSYVQQLLWIAFALLIAISITIVDRKRPGYSIVAYWMRITVRYYLCLVLLLYGLDKVLGIQFPLPGLHRLVQPLGKYSPMGLAWNFVGFSKAYNIYLGGAEVIAGILLLFKRTTLLGSLIAMTILINIAALNFCYDIPVKLFSMNLVLVAFYLAAYDLQRAKNFFLLNKNAPAVALTNSNVFQGRRWLYGLTKLAAILFVFYVTLVPLSEQLHKYGPDAPKPPLYGIYNTDVFIKKTDTLPPLTTDTTRWKQVVISRPGFIYITTMNDSTRRMKLRVDTAENKLVVTNMEDSVQQYAFRYLQTDKDHLSLSGRIEVDSIFINMKRYDENSFLLLNRGFHWINEYPFNR